MFLYWLCLPAALPNLIFLNSFTIRYATEIASLTTLQETAQTLSYQVNTCEADIRVEREWRCDLQEKEQKAKEQINALQLHIKQLNDEIRGHDRARNELERMRKQWSEAQMTLEELGIQLSLSKLQVSELQEKANDVSNSRMFNDSNGGAWIPDNSTSTCKQCDREFSLTRRKVIHSFLSLQHLNLAHLNYSIIVVIAVIYFAIVVRKNRLLYRMIKAR